MTTETQMYPTTKAAVLDFITIVLTTISGTFTGEELRNFAIKRVTGGTSPTSVDRALRQLRQEYKLDYYVLNRGKGLYKALPVFVFPVQD
jgi:hypothetical protein